MTGVTGGNLLMQKLRFIKQASLDRLQANIVSNQKLYAGKAVWLDSYFAGSTWFSDSDIRAEDTLELQLPASKTELFDLENTKIVYSALRHLTPVEASDPRLWAYFTHVTHWEYMRRRWPIEQYLSSPRLKDNMQEHYFFMSDRSRALTRNGMARLWWYGYCSYDESRKDPFELTSALLKNLDVASSILERTFSRNRAVTKTLLDVLLDRERVGQPFYVRDQVRDLAKYMVRIGGVTIIDALQEPELRNVVRGKIEQILDAVQA